MVWYGGIVNCRGKKVLICGGIVDIRGVMVASGATELLFYVESRCIMEKNELKKMVLSSLEKTEYSSLTLHWSNKIGQHYIKGSFPVVLADVCKCEVEDVCEAIADMIRNGDIHYKAKNIPNPLTGAVLTEHCLMWDLNLKQSRPLTQDCRLSIKLPIKVDNDGFTEPVASLSKELGFELV